MQDQLAAWTLDTIKDNPQRYGGDDGNPAIILQYLREASPSDSITLMTLETVSNAVTVSRLKNQLLLKYPEYDHRVKNQSKPRITEHPNQGQLFTIRDYMSETELKIADFLNDNPERWTWSVSRIAKSVRGADRQAIECILNHRDLYEKLETETARKTGANSEYVETKKYA